MKIIDIITKMKQYCKGERNGRRIDDATTRDQILYGNPQQECTGVVTTIYASPTVIKKAAELGANLIISHEALFWNHGDHTDWLKETKNKTFTAKTKLLDQAGIVVWRDHDYIHSGIPMASVPGGYIDGIFYGFAKAVGWNQYVVGDGMRPTMFELPAEPLKNVADELMQKLNLQGFKTVGDQNTMVHKVWIPGHIMEGNPHANDMITYIDQNQIDLLLPLEMIDYTVCEYVRDSALLGYPRAILSMGHFNLEEPGMEYMPEYFNRATGCDLPCTYVQAGDMYGYLTRKGNH